MTTEGWRGFDVVAFNARSARSRERDAEAQQRVGVVAPCKQPDAVQPTPDALPLTLVLPFPPSTNHDKGGTYHLTPDTRAFRHAVAGIVQARGAHQLRGRLAVTITLYPAPARRAFDIDNRVKPLLDALQHAGAFVNDEAVDYLYLHRVVGVATDALTERCIVTITPLDVPPEGGMSDMNGAPWADVPRWPSTLYGIAVDVRFEGPTLTTAREFDREAFLFLGADAARRFVDGGLHEDAIYGLRLLRHDTDGSCEFQLVRLER